MSVADFWKRAVMRLFGARRRPPAPPLDPEVTAEILRAFEAHVGIPFTNATLLEQALTHRSYLGGESENLPASNERLEFLGDAVLELVVIEHLFHTFPDDREGDLTQKKSLLVSKSVLADRADELDLGQYLLLSPAERGAGGAERHSILADAFEAVLGAIYLDRGVDTARRFVNRWLLADTERILADTDHRNFKSILQERVQARLRVHPRYRVVSEEGPDHHKRCTVEVAVSGRILGVGRGHNKKEAEQQAAREALVSGALTQWLEEIRPR